MTWYVFVYNKVQDKVTEIHTLEDHEPVPDQVFLQTRVNGELDAYFRGSSDARGWGAWNKGAGAWFPTENPPNQVKLARMLV